MDYFFAGMLIVLVVASVYLFHRRRLILVSGAVYLIGIAATWLVMGKDTGGYRTPPPPDAMAASRPQQEAFDGYVSSDTCRSCHPGEYHSWHATYHRTMTQIATPESVLARDFEGRTFLDGGLAFVLERRGDEFWTKISLANQTAPTPADVRERRIVMTTGSHNYQIYWLDGDYLDPERPDDRKVTIFPFVYLLDEKQWVPRLDAFLTPPFVGLNSLHAGDWNTTCLNCHSTHGAPHSVLSQEIMTTRVAEFGIACESCHGPGQAHVEAHRDPLARYEAHRQAAAGARNPTIVNPAKLDKELSSHVCARCHALTAGFYNVRDYPLHGYTFKPGEHLEKTFVRSRLIDWQTNPALQTELAKDPGMLGDLFWSDGMVRVSGREFNGLLETKCFQEGEMSCLSCHQMHKADSDLRTLPEWAVDQMAAGRQDNNACLQCHEGLADDAALVAHTRHPVASSGSSCYNCHMPHTTFGLLKAVRSHTVDSPSVASSLATGRPNACNQCHLDKTLGWTAQALTQWHGQPLPELNDDQQNIAASVLWALQGNANQRALMAWSFGWAEARQASGDDWMGVYLSFLLEDPYAAIRLVARKSLRQYPGFESLPAYPFPADMKSRAFALWTRQHPAGLGPHAGPLLLERNGTFQLDPVWRLLRARDHTPINLRE